MIIDFIKMTGAGNDFILIDNRNRKYNAISWAKIAPSICDRHFGVGADGLLVIESSKNVDFLLKYFNSDGSYGGMCGNGGRCAARFFIDDISVSHCRFESLNYIYSSKRLDDLNISIKMKPVSIDKLEDIIDLNDNQIPIYFIDTGAPHAVIFMDDLTPDLIKHISDFGISNLGKIVRNHPKFQPEGTNVDFIDIKDDKSILMRTYERGVEAVTLACGTGAVASACVSSAIRNILPPLRVKTSSNKILIVNFRRDGGVIKDVELTGPAVKVFSGFYEYAEGNY